MNITVASVHSEQPGRKKRTYVPSLTVVGTRHTHDAVVRRMAQATQILLAGYERLEAGRASIGCNQTAAAQSKEGTA